MRRLRCSCLFVWLIVSDGSAMPCNAVPTPTLSPARPSIRLSRGTPSRVLHGTPQSSAVLGGARLCDAPASIRLDGRQRQPLEPCAARRRGRPVWPIATARGCCVARRCDIREAEEGDSWRRRKEGKQPLSLTRPRGVRRPAGRRGNGSVLAVSRPADTWQPVREE